MQKKTLLAALTLSPSSKAITEINEKLWLVVERHWRRVETFYNATIVNMTEGDTVHTTGRRTGPADIQEWLDNVSWAFDEMNVDVLEKRWKCIEEATMCHRCSER